MAPVRVDGAEDQVVFEHDAAVEARDVDFDSPRAARNAREADDAGARRVAEDVEHDLRGAGALDHDVGLEPRDRGHLAPVVMRAEVAGELRLRAILHAVVHVGLASPLRAHERGEQADGTGTRDQDADRTPASRAVADALNLLPGLGDDARGLGQHAERAEFRRHADDEARIHADQLGAIAVALLDAALGVLTVPAHVPFADRAARAGYGIGPAHDARDEGAHRVPAAGRRLDDLQQRLVAEHEAIAPGRRLSVLAVHDLPVRAADPDCERPQEKVAIDPPRRRDFQQLDCARNAGANGERANRLRRFHDQYDA